MNDFSIHILKPDSASTTVETFGTATWPTDHDCLLMEICEEEPRLSCIHCYGTGTLEHGPL